MSRTADEHRTIGILLGFPSCCVEEWVADHERLGSGPIRYEEGMGTRRGSITTHYRSDAEVEVLIQAGVPAVCFDGDRAARRVPCARCRRQAHQAGREIRGLDPIYG